MNLARLSVRAVGLLAVPLVGITLAVPLAASAPRLRATSAPRVVARPMRPAMAGMVIGIDRETGMLVMPAPDQLARLAAQSQARAVSLRPAMVRKADGSMSLDVRSWMREHSIVRLGPDGRPVLDCVDGHDAVVEALRHTPAAPSGAEER